MSFEVRINGNNINDYLISYTRNHNLCEGVGKIKLEVDNNLSASIGDTIVLYEDSIKKGEYFLKEITNVVEEGKKVLDGQDDSWKLENFFITDNITIETAQTNLYYIEWLLSESGVDYDLDVDSSEAQYLELGTTIGMENAIDLLKNLCRYSAWYFWFDANNTCHISKIKTDIANTSETLTDDEILDISVRFDDKMLRNRGLVYGGANLINGGYIVGEQTRRTGYEYDDRDLRTVVYSNPNLSYQSSVNTIARKLVDEFAKITVVKDVTLPGFWDLKINDSVFLQSEYYTGACLIMALESSATEGGMLTKLTLDSRCPKLVTFFEHDYVYIGTAGMGIWRKPYTIIGSWENYSTGIAVTDLYIKDLKINNGLFVCIGGDNVYRRTLNTNWQKLSLPAEYSSYYATGIVIDAVDNNFYASYTNGTDSIEVKFNPLGGIIYINPIVIEGFNTGAPVIDIDLYNRTPVITTGNIFNLYPPDGNFISYFLINNYILFSNKIITFFNYNGSTTVTLYTAVTKTKLQEAILTSSTSNTIVAYLEDSNTCIFGVYFGGYIRIYEYSIPANTITFVKDISTPVNSPVIHLEGHFLLTRNWAFSLKTQSFISFNEYLDGQLFYYYTFSRKIIHIKLYNVSIYQGSGGDYPGAVKQQEQRVKVTIIDIDRFYLNIIDDLLFPIIDWSSDIWVYLTPDFTPGTGGRNWIFTTESFTGRMYLGFLAKRTQKHVTYFFGVPSGFDWEITDYRYVVIDLNTGVFTGIPLTQSEYVYENNKLFVQNFYDGNPWSGYFKIPVQADSSDNGRKVFVYRTGVRPYYNGYFDILTREKYFNYTDVQFSPNFLVPVIGLDYYLLVSHSRSYYYPSFYAVAVNKINIADINNVLPIPSTNILSFTGLALGFFGLGLNIAFFDYYGWVFHFQSNIKAFAFRTEISQTPYIFFNTAYKEGNSYKIIDAYLDPSTLENSQEGTIFTYPINDNPYPQSIRLSFIPELGEFYTVSGSVLSSLTQNNVIDGKVTDGRIYYESDNYYGFSDVTLSGQEDNYKISLVLSGFLKTSGIDLLDNFSNSTFSGVMKIETSNYSDLYFLSTSGNKFYQKVYPSNYFQEASVNIPSSNITIIRLDDRL